MQSTIGLVTDIIFLKPGGFLITDKTKAYSPGALSLEWLAGELNLVLGGQRGDRLISTMIASD